MCTSMWTVRISSCAPVSTNIAACDGSIFVKQDAQLLSIFLFALELLPCAAFSTPTSSLRRFFGTTHSSQPRRVGLSVLQALHAMRLHPRLQPAPTHQTRSEPEGASPAQEMARLLRSLTECRRVGVTCSPCRRSARRRATAAVSARTWGGSGRRSSRPSPGALLAIARPVRRRQAEEAVEKGAHSDTRSRRRWQCVALRTDSARLRGGCADRRR